MPAIRLRNFLTVRGLADQVGDPQLGHKLPCSAKHEPSGVASLAVHEACPAPFLRLVLDRRSVAGGEMEQREEQQAAAVEVPVADPSPAAAIPVAAQVAASVGNQAFGAMLGRMTEGTVPRAVLMRTPILARDPPPAAPPASRLGELDEMLDRFNTPEDEVITLCGELSAADKATVIAGYRDRIANALDIGEMVRCLRNLDPPKLTTKLEWVEAAATLRSSIDYSDIKAFVTAAPQGERDGLKTGRWQDFFVDVCDNTTIVEAVDDLGYDLETKLNWLKAEVTSVRAEIGYADIQRWVTAAPQAQRDALKTTGWRDFFTQVCTNATIITAVGDLGFDLATQLEWVMAEMNWVRAELGYADIKPLITKAGQAQRDSLKTTGWRDTFTLICDNDTMAQAVDDLGWPLITALDWMLEEGTDYAHLKARITRTPAEQAAVLADTPTLRKIQSEMSWNDFAKCVELLGRTAPAAGPLLADGAVQGQLASAWAASQVADPAKRHEEGGWIYLNLITGAITVTRATAGAQASIQLSSPPTEDDSVVVGYFHTHPNPTAEGWLPGPSPADLRNAPKRQVPAFIRADDGDHTYGAGSRLHLAGDRGYPGAGGGEAPQARSLAGGPVEDVGCEGPGDMNPTLESDLDRLRPQAATLDYDAVKPLVLGATEESRAGVRGEEWRAFFEALCGEARLAEAAADLGWPELAGDRADQR